ncbi:XRE family transcriptional regulator [Longimicrobium sp.]|uniref:XRE family transcriptional regulator n=1 Tax=Longimicrobium sp. TaxID=2029185 RepID=UPI002E373E91|nr:XRE family transcriptional regulator [Longimicrobium sp.]HEX6040207.1 XRE family transcriptional regulator [Longimicrobium sp.]
MNALECLRERLGTRFPDAELSIDKAETDTGSWFLDATLQEYMLVVEWRPDRGFGISTPSPDDYGAKPDEVYVELNAAYERIKALLLSQTPTKPPVRATLPELREAQKLSQAELANRLSINQGACSRMERRNDMLVGTLRNVVAAMGGELRLVAEFPDRTVYIDLDAVAGRNGATPADPAAA